MKLKRIIPLLLAALMLVTFPMALFSCSSGSPTVMELGGEKVSYNLLRYFTIMYMDGLTAADYEKDEAMQQELTENVTSALRKLVACHKAAEEYEVELTEDEQKAIDDQITTFKESYESEEAYTQAITAQFGDEETFRRIIELNTLQEKLYKYLTHEYYGIIKSDDPTVRADIEAGNFFAAEYLFIYCSAGDRAEKGEFAETLRSRIANGESMEAIDKEYQTEYSLQMDYCNLPCFTYTEELQYFEDAVLALSVGEVADVIERSNGFLIVKRNELDQTYIDENFLSVVESYINREYTRYMENYAAGLELKWKSKYKDLKLWEIE